MANASARFDLGLEGSATVVLVGDWTVRSRQPLEPILAQLNAVPGLKRLAVEASALGSWDSYLLIVLEALHKRCTKQGIDLDIHGLPEGVQGLLKLAWAVPERAGARRQTTKPSILARRGAGTLAALGDMRAALAFAGELVIGLRRMLTGKARYRKSDILLFMQEGGAEALPIVTLISLLVGTILAFVGSIQLKMFGAEIFVADLVGVGMALEMGALMTAIIMAGRTGASYAAQLGTMQVNEEIDALQTMGLSAFDYLVLPRTVALVFMMPLLCLYADVMGMIGGAIVGIFYLGLEPVQYYAQTTNAVSLNHFAQGLIKASAFGVVIAFCGSLQGMRCGRSAQAVGEATTTKGDVFVIMGGSGCGKSTLMRHMIGLLQPAAGRILYSGKDFWSAPQEERDRMLRRMGVLYQAGALWSSMTLAENIGLPLSEYTDLTPAEIRDIAAFKLSLVGLSGFEDFYPSEISGGMRKRAGLARAMALDPEILFFDEPSAGLDPISAKRLDDLILELRDSLGATVVIVTHELASIFAVSNNSVFLDPITKTMIAAGDPKDLRDSADHPEVRRFLRRGVDA